MSRVPEKYWINHLTYKCDTCGSTFEDWIPNGYDIVKLEAKGNGEVRWLPTYGTGGYIDLMTKLIPNHNKNDEITMEKSKTFIRKLERYSEKGKLGCGFELSRRISNCINCDSKDLKTINEEVLVNPELEWLKISCDLIK